MTSALKHLVATDKSLSAFILRVFLALLILPHGLQKTVGMFGGHGLGGTLEFFTGTMDMPWIVALLVIAGESLGAIAILLGVFTRFCTASLAVIMSGAIVMVHWQNGFFMNWYGNQKGEGFEYHLLVIGMTLSLLVSGAGRWSLDSKIQEHIKK